MSFEEAAAYLDALGVDAMKQLTPTLDRIDALCELLNRPERSAPAIHITGTNGKSSTAAIVTSLLGALGLSVGTYTSPHLTSVTERLSLAGEPISDEEFGDVFDHLKPYVDVVEKRLDDRLSYFEVLTAMFFLWAAEKPVDAMVVEVGLGGRWDATNVVPGEVSVITNIGLDHTELLGPDRSSIAGEKAGIIKDGAVVVTAEKSSDALGVIEVEAAKHGSAMRVFDKDFFLNEDRLALGGRYLSILTSTKGFDGVFLPLHGQHQGVNAAVALEAVSRFAPTHELDEEAVAEGFGAARVPGRMELIRQASSTQAPIMLDVAHNADGMSALVKSIIEAFSFENVVVVLGVLSDKDHESMLRELSRINPLVLATAARSSRSRSPGDLVAAAEGLGLRSEAIDGVSSAVAEASRIAGPGDLICVTGSHYVVGEARGHLAPSR